MTEQQTPPSRSDEPTAAAERDRRPVPADAPSATTDHGSYKPSPASALGWPAEPATPRPGPADAPPYDAGATPTAPAEDEVRGATDASSQSTTSQVASVQSGGRAAPGWPAGDPAPAALEGGPLGGPVDGPVDHGAEEMTAPDRLRHGIEDGGPALPTAAPSSTRPVAAARPPLDSRPVSPPTVGSSAGGATSGTGTGTGTDHSTAGVPRRGRPRRRPLVEVLDGPRTAARWLVELSIALTLLFAGLALLLLLGP